MKILLADDHQMMRDGLQAILERAGLVVVGGAHNGREAIALTRELRPDVVVMDIAMPELNGIEATRLLAAELPQTKVIALSMNSDRRYVRAMFQAGAVGYLIKSSAAEELLRAVHAVAEGQKYVSPAIADIVLEGICNDTRGPESGPSRALTMREREVLQLLAEGKSSKEIATTLGVAMSTIETHRRQIMQKLDLRTVAELTKYAVREGLTTLE